MGSPGECAGLGVRTPEPCGLCPEPGRPPSARLMVTFCKVQGLGQWVSSHFY